MKNKRFTVGASRASNSARVGVCTCPLGLVTAIEITGLAGDGERERDSSAPSMDSSDQSCNSSLSSAKDGSLGMSTSNDPARIAGAAVASEGSNARLSVVFLAESYVFEWAMGQKTFNPCSFIGVALDAPVQLPIARIWAINWCKGGQFGWHW